MIDSPMSRLSARFSHGQLSRVTLRSQTGQFRLSEQCGEHLGHSRYYLVEVGPGLFPGEEHKVDLEIMPGHGVIITQQSATKVMPASNSAFAKMEVELTVGNQSSLLFLAEPTIMQPSAALRSETTIYMGEDAKLLYTEIIGEPLSLKNRPGYPGMLSSQLRLFRNGSLEYCDSIIVEDSPVFSAWECWQRVFGGSKASGSCYLVGYSSSLIERTIGTVGDVHRTDKTVCVASAEPAPWISVIRVLAPGAEMIMRYFYDLANALNSEPCL